MRKHIITLTISALGIVLIFFTFNNIGINISRSVPFTLYTINKQKKEFHEGDYVLFYKQADPLHILPKGAKLVKMIACAPGSILKSSEDAWYCDGNKVAVRRYPKIMKFNFNGIVPADKMFMTGSAFRSYDSRIWGFMDVNKIIAVVNPIF